MRSVRRHVHAVLCGLLAWLSVLSIPSAIDIARADVDSSQLTREELGRLQAGELVQRPSVKMRAGVKLMGGSSWQLINASPEIVWRALLDTPHYPRMMPQVIEARLVATRDDQRTVFMRQGSAGLLEAKYHLKVKVDAVRRGLTFSVDERLPHEVVEGVWGFYNVQPYGERQTLLAYGVMADIRGGVLGGVLRGSMHEWMLRTPWMIKRFVEGSGRWIYH
jgi:ribosome-associated toxin RatA of RatAB toxin-antitoxin module